jgi:hypothetical protein
MDARSILRTSEAAPCVPRSRRSLPLSNCSTRRDFFGVMAASKSILVTHRTQHAHLRFKWIEGTAFAHRADGSSGEDGSPDCGSPQGTGG